MGFFVSLREKKGTRYLLGRTLQMVPGTFFFILLVVTSVLAKEPEPAWLSRIPAQFSQEATDLVLHPTFTRQPSPQTLNLKADFFGYLLQDWELAGRLAKTLDLKGYEVTTADSGWKVRLNPRFSVDVIPLIHDNGASLFFLRGEYQGKWIHQLKGRGIFLIQYHLRPGGNPATETRIKTYIHIDQMLAAILAKISMPLIGRRFDERLSLILTDIQQTSRKIRESPKWAGQRIQASSLFNEEEKKLLVSKFITPKSIP